MPRPWLGTETVARMLGLRINHLQAEDARELQVSQPVTRAEAAYSIARVLTIQQYELDSVRLALDTFAFEQLSVWQQNVLRRALRLVGSPYVWAGTSERPQPFSDARSREASTAAASSGASTSSSPSRAHPLSPRCSREGRPTT